MKIFHKSLRIVPPPRGVPPPLPAPPTPSWKQRGKEWGSKLVNTVKNFNEATGPDVNIFDPTYTPSDKNPQEQPVTDTPVAKAPVDLTTLSPAQIVAMIRDPRRIAPVDLATIEADLTAVGKNLSTLSHAEVTKLVEDYHLLDKLASSRKWILVYAGS